MKRLLSILLVLVMVFSLVACGKDEGGTEESTGPKANEGDKLVVWTFTDEVKQMVEEYYLVDNPDLDYEIEVVVVPTDQYQPKLDPVLASGKEAPDVFTLEAAFVKKYVDSKHTKDLATLGLADNPDMMQYVQDVATDADGALKGLSWQATPGAFFYRRSIAQEYLGVSEPEEVQALISDFDKFLEVAKKINDDSNGEVKAISSLGDLLNVYYAAREDGWVVDGKFVIDPQIENLMEMAKTLESQGLTNQAEQWTETWFASMNGDDVFGYFLPTWGLHYVLKTNAENAESGESTSGDWAMVQGPAGYFWGGTWVGVREGTKMEQASADLVNYLTRDEAFLEKWATNTGDFLNNTKVVDKIKDTYTEPFLAGQKHYAAFAEMTDTINAKVMTGYDKDINDVFNEQLTAYAKGEKSLEDALSDLKAAVKNTFPDLTVE